jgi:GNAT superfamily N-acetyltransferase
MTMTWQKESAPHWDADKQALFGPTELASAGLQAVEPNTPIADEWWRVATEDGRVVGYGWLDSEWGNARISFFVAPAARGSGAGEFILDRLEEEAVSRGLNYIYNIVPDTHPDQVWMTNWLSLHGFQQSHQGELRRQVAASHAREQA